jgi:hypothetical protein
MPVPGTLRVGAYARAEGCRDSWFSRWSEVFYTKASSFYRPIVEIQGIRDAFCILHTSHK